jgi:retron-type reverse transcriptase
MGWPKGCKTYGHRVGVVPYLRVTSLGYSLGNARTKGRPTVFNVSDSRSYSTGGTNNVANAIDSLAQHCSERPDKVVDRKLYKMLCSEGFLIIAYNKIKGRPGNITSGIVNERIDNGFILELSQELRSETFKFTPGRRVQIYQAKGGARPLTIAYFRDRIVQEAIRIILNAIYEPTFLESSHGFRPNRGCHTALEAIKQNFKSAS